MTEQVECTYSGTITIRANGEDDEALFLDPAPERADDPLALVVAEDIELHGNTVSVSYWIADEPRTMGQLVENEVKKLAGAVDADYTQHGSEITGYLWTDVELVIDGHDLLDELSTHDGRWCLLVMKFGERP